MNTPAHLIIGAAGFARPAQRGTLLAALLGGFAPDLSLYLMAGVSLFILQIPPQVVFDEFYFSAAWQQVFAIDNSIPLWGLVFTLGVWLKRPWLVALAGAALLHLVADFALHHDDARAHFWPLSDWRFSSPVSYWDQQHGARWIGPLEGLLCAALLCLLWRRFRDSPLRAGFGILFAAELLALSPVLWGMS